MPLGGVRHGATLAYLLLHSNEMVSISRLMAAVWPARVPPTGRQMLYNAIFRLRRILSAGGGGEELLRDGPGYVLRVPDSRLDVRQFQALEARGRGELAAGLWSEASDTFRDALGLWRGPALEDLVEHGYAWPESTALDNARTSALEGRIEADIALGRYRDVIGDLEGLVRAEPLREQACGWLMQALYHCGRQADALSLYRRTRGALVDQLGIEPSPQLRALESAVLNHDLERALPSPVLNGCYERY
ncbi:AfsR/SARP family transcriptional regulator [Streptomyces sp. HNA39]|uniref:AfsR/SARP family transcriptional regulator n=1 Tax=Streptomyces sp. HNA39 TaxID=2850561 RepID=UPI0020100941|nr:AfsR/SARP family transcriptional regulator [Streptomyces sp. HNA39]UQA36859.1 AfsR/SARP family transcriptional regulator [Streptomyces sp. HNA39]